MGENEKLGFSFEEVPFDFSTFNRFFGATTPWVDEGASATITWNGSQIPKDDTDFKSLSEKTAKAFEKSCNDYLETLSEVSKSLNPCLERLATLLAKPHKNKKKHYKPKFTL